MPLCLLAATWVAPVPSRAQAPAEGTEAASVPPPADTEQAAPADAAPEAAAAPVPPTADTGAEAAAPEATAPAPAEAEASETAPSEAEAAATAPGTAETPAARAPEPAAAPAAATAAKPPAPGSEPASGTAPQASREAPPKAPDEAPDLGPPPPKANWRKVKNPVTPNEASVQRGRELYGGKGMCNVCHGDAGDGFGPVRSQFTPFPNAFFDPAWHASLSDGEIMGVLQDGKYGTGMVPFVPQFLTEPEGWDVVNFLRSLKGKTTENYERYLAALREQEAKIKQGPQAPRGGTPP